MRAPARGKDVVDELEKFMNRGMDAQKAVDQETIRQDLQIAISGVQSTIEHTNEDETRTRMKTVLKALQRTSRELELDRKREG